MSKNSINARCSLTQRGALIMGAGLVFVLIGLSRGDGVLSALGLAAFILLSVAYFLAKNNNKGMLVKCQAAHQVYAGNRFPVRVTIENHRRFVDAFTIQVTIFLPGSGECKLAAPWIAANSAADVDAFFPLEKRGHSRTLPITLRSAFPLGLWESVNSLEVAHELIVYPRPLRMASLQLTGMLHDATPSAGSTFGTMHGEIRGLRPWRAGDSFKMIHAAASARSFARGAGLIVAEADPPGFYPKKIAVLFHSYASDRAMIRPEHFEKALSMACGSLRYLLAQAIPTEWVADFDGWLTHQCDNRLQLAGILELLAGAKRSKHTELHELTRACAMIDSDATLLIISDMPISLWQHAVPQRTIKPVIIPVTAIGGNHLTKKSA